MGLYRCAVWSIDPKARPLTGFAVTCTVLLYMWSDWRIDADNHDIHKRQGNSRSSLRPSVFLAGTSNHPAPRRRKRCLGLGGRTREPHGNRPPSPVTQERCASSCSVVSRAKPRAATIIGRHSSTGIGPWQRRGVETANLSWNRIG